MSTEQERVKAKIDGFINKYVETQVHGWSPAIDKDYIPKEKNTESYMSEGRMPLFCPKCTRVMNKKLDNKMYWIHNTCFDCVIEMETQLRIEGKWEEYERNKVKENIRSYIKDTAQQVEEFCKNTAEGSTYMNVVNEDLGSVDYEKWKLSDEEAKLHTSKARSTLQMMYDDFEKSFGEKV